MRSIQNETHSVTQCRSIQHFVTDLKARSSELHILVNNAAVWCPEDSKTVEGMEVWSPIQDALQALTGICSKAQKLAPHKIEIENIALHCIPGHLRTLSWAFCIVNPELHISGSRMTELA